MKLKNNKRYKKLEVLIAVFSFLSSPFFASDLNWGGAVQSSAELLSTQENILNIENSLDLWLEHEFSSSYSMDLSIGYTSLYEDDVLLHIPRISDLVINGTQEGSTFKIGRFSMTDYGGVLVDVPQDGLEYVILGDGLEIVTAIGYTGLVFNRNSNIILTASDLEDYEDNEIFASPRFVQFAELDLFLSDNKTFYATILTQGDMRDDESLTDGYGVMNNIYLSLGFSGSAAESSFNYNVYAIGEAGTYEIPSEDRSLLILAGAAGAEIDYTLDIALKPILSAELFYSTGDDWSRTDWQGSSIETSLDTLNQFNPYSAKDIGYVYNTRAGNIFYGDFGITVNATSSIMISLSSLTLFRSQNGPVYAIPISTSSSDLYLGEELSLEVNTEITESLFFDLKGGVFFPNESLVTEEMQYKVSANLSFLF